MDELILLDVAATLNDRGPRFGDISKLASSIFCPLTVGGGVRTEDDFRQLLASGADKVAINTVAIDCPEFVTAASKRFGAQAVVASIDCARGRVYHRCGSKASGKLAVDWARELMDRGAGEILLTSIIRDGMMNGYDLDLIAEVSGAVDIPVVAAGGCGSYEHILGALRAGAHACAVGAMFQFMDATPKGAARYLAQQGYHVRL